MNVVIKPSNKPNKKYMAVIDDKKVIHFGDDRYEDFTTHKNEARKSYIWQDIKHDHYTNPLYASFYSTNLLWTKPTLTEAIRSTNLKYKNLNIKLK